MARYEHLPIYKKAMDLTVYLEKIVRNFSRYHKYTLGAELSGSPLERNLRRVIVRNFPFSVVCRPDVDGGILVFAVAHDARRPGYWRSWVSNP